MKKIMVGILVLIPIIILVTMGIVSNFVSTRAHIAVEDIELDNSTLGMDLGAEIYDLNEFLKVSVLPERATDRSFVWSISNLVCFDPDYEDKYKEYLVEEENYYAKLTEYRADLAEYEVEYAEWLAEKKENPDLDRPAPVAPVAPEEPIEVGPAATLVDDAGKRVDENSTGKLKINSYCSFYVVVQAETKTARCHVYVGGENIESVHIEGENSVGTGENLMLEALFTPIDSIVTQCEWTSSDERVAVVDDNGVVTGVAEGEAFIRVRAKKHSSEGYAQSADFKIKVTKSASRYGNEFQVGVRTLSLSALGVENPVAVSGCSIEGDALTITGDVAVIETKHGTLTVGVCGEDEIAIRNAEEYGVAPGVTENYYVLGAGATALPLKLEAVWKSVLKDGAPAGAEWSSDNEDVAVVDENGLVRGRRSGVAVITLTANGQHTSLTLIVEEKVTALVLGISNESLAVGIARETVFGSYEYDDNMNLIASGVTIDFVRPIAPEDASDFEVFVNGFEFSVDKPELAYFEGNRLVFRPENITGRTDIQVTVKAKYPKYHHMSKYTTAQFTVSVTHGYNVSTIAQIRAAARAGEDVYNNVVKPQATSADGVVDYDRINDEMKGKYAICLRDNIFAGETNVESIKTYGDIYGNNFMIYAAKRAMMERGRTLVYVKYNHDRLISNLIIRPNETGEEITTADDSQGFLGSGIQTDSYGGPLINLRIEYTIIENVCMAIEAINMNLDLDGCILRNSSEVGVWVPCDFAGDTSGVARYSYINVNNCVMSNLLGMAFQLSYDGHGKNPDAAQEVANGKNIVFRQTGFMDVYNWQRLDVLSILPKGTINDILGEQLAPLFETLIRDIVAQDPIMQNMRKTYNNAEYVHFGFMSTGLNDKSYADVECEDPRFVRINSYDLTAGAAGLLKGLHELYLWGYSNTVTDVVPGRGYSVNRALIDRLNPAKASAFAA